MSFTRNTNAIKNSEQTKSKSQPSSLRMYQLNQKHFAAAGIHPNLVTQQYPFNCKILLGFLILIISVVWNLMFSFRGAKTFAEYTQSTYMWSLGTLIILVLVNILLNLKKLFNFINEYENLANTRELKNQISLTNLLVQSAQLYGKKTIFSFKIFSIAWTLR